MIAGRLDARLGLFEPTQGVDAIGAPVETWVDRGSVWAHVMPLRDAERFANSEVTASLTHRFHVRRSSLTSEINAKWRVVYDGRNHDVVAVKEIGRNVGFEITASARAD